MSNNEPPAFTQARTASDSGSPSARAVSAAKATIFVPENPNQPYEMRELINRVVEGVRDVRIEGTTGTVTFFLCQPAQRDATDVSWTNGSAAPIAAACVTRRAPQ